MQSVRMSQNADMGLSMQQNCGRHLGMILRRFLSDFAFRYHIGTSTKMNLYVIDTANAELNERVVADVNADLYEHVIDKTKAIQDEQVNGTAKTDL